MGEAMNTTDYPAAHSMDTSWFGVDASGELAQFESGEEGVRPIEVKEQQDETCLFIPDLQKLMAGLAAPYPAERTADEIFADHRCTEAPPPKVKGGAMIFQLRSVEEGDAMIEAAVPDRDWGIHLPTCDGHLLYLDHVLCVDVPALVERFRPLRWGFWLDERLSMGPPPAFYGFWTFVGQRWGEPYKRLDAPKPPLRLEQLPEKLQGYARCAIFSGIRFADTPILQPVEHMKCIAYACNLFIDSSLKLIRPIPGFEDHYKAQEADLRRSLAGLYDVRPWDEPWPRPY